MEKTQEKAPAAAGESKTLYAESMQLGKREYRFEYRESAKGNRFLSVADSHERNGKMSRDSILVFEDQIPQFMEALQKAVGFAKKK